MSKRSLYCSFALCLTLCLTATSVFAQTRTVTDTTGTEVTLPDEINRIASLWHANNQVILLLGGADKLVGTTSVIKDLPWFAAVYPRIREVPSLVRYDAYFNAEDVLQTSPDLVICNRPRDVERLRDLGLTVVTLSFADFDGLKNSVAIMAEILGGEAPKRAEEFIAYFDGNLALLKERLADLEEADKPVVYQIRSTNPTYTDGKISICTQWIEAGGGINAMANVTDRNQAIVTMEEIARANPSVIIASAPSDAQAILDKIKTDAEWAEIEAVKQNQLYVNPVGTFLWNRYSCEEALQVLWVAKLLHPGRFADIDMFEEVREFYLKFYGYELSEKAAERLLAGQEPL